jgi:Uma2 family endonuclease
VFDSIGRFIMPNTDLFAPDVVFVSAQRLRQTVRDFAELVPDLVMEIKSKTDCIHLLQEKIQLFLTLEAL